MSTKISPSAAVRLGRLLGCCLLFAIGSVGCGASEASGDQPAASDGGGPQGPSNNDGGAPHHSGGTGTRPAGGSGTHEPGTGGSGTQEPGTGGSGGTQEPGTGGSGGGEAIDECDLGTHDCDPLSTCVDTTGGFYCDGCPQGYTDVHGDGTLCEDTDECELGTHDCDPNATCTNTDGSYTCTCKATYVGSGTNCYLGTSCNPSDPANCHAQAACLEDGSGDDFCTCNPGYDGDGLSCQDIDECDGANPCGANGVCQNQPGSYSCDCDAGYTFDGTTCQDINECVDVKICGEHGVCQNQAGSYSCDCDAGYTFDGTTCQDINECVDVKICGAGTCRNQPGSYSCDCNSGYAFNGTTCQDIDECAEGLHDCDPIADCRNTAGSFSCTCPGNTIDTHGDGTHCDSDLCPDDPTKTEPGACGCGVPDIDSDGDGTFDCLDGCIDVDGDGYGQGPECLGVDCDDSDPNQWASCGSCIDADGDGRGSGCDLGNDCDDGNPTSWSDCETCAGSDYDADGYGALCDTDADCDDRDPSVHPGAPEIPDDGIDNDCAGDGDATHTDLDAIYVAGPQLCDWMPDAAPITDDNPGTASAPVATIGKALEIAAESGRTRPIVAAAGALFSDASFIQLVGGKLFGGYDYDCFSSWEPSTSAHTVLANSNPTAPFSIGIGSSKGWVVHRVTMSGNVTAMGSGYLVDVNFPQLKAAQGTADPTGTFVLARSVIDFDTPLGGTVLDIRGGHLLMGANHVERGNDNRGLALSHGGSLLAVHNGASATLVENVLIGSAIGVIVGNDPTGGNSGIVPDGQISAGHVLLRANLITPKLRAGAADSIGVRVAVSGSTAILEDNVIRPSEDPQADRTIGLAVGGGWVTLDGDRIESGSGSEHAHAAIVSGDAQVTARNAVFQGSAAGALDETVGVRVGGQWGGWEPSNDPVDAQLHAVNTVFLGGNGASNAGLRVMANGGSPEVLVAHGVILGGNGEASAGVHADILSTAGSLTVVNSVVESGAGSDSRVALVNLQEMPVTLAGNSVRLASGGTPSVHCLIQGTSSCLQTISLVNACSWTGCAESVSNKSLVPGFVAPAKGDYHLPSGSALIDAGIDPNDFVPSGFVLYDIDGDQRPNGRDFDIGIDEVPGGRP